MKQIVEQEKLDKIKKIALDIIPESLTGDFSWYCVALLVHHSKTRTRKTTRGKKK
jgi:hypothetical protein